jgi:hypothetical protein
VSDGTSDVCSPLFAKTSHLLPLLTLVPSPFLPAAVLSHLQIAPSLLLCFFFTEETPPRAPSSTSDSRVPVRIPAKSARSSPPPAPQSMLTTSW